MGLKKGGGVPLQRICARIWKEVDEVLLFVGCCDGSPAFGNGKMPEIGGENGLNGVTVR
jgi:hypothetical protein